MPSFDIVSELNWQEVDNAVNQTQKEIAQRFDFKGVGAEINFDKTKKIISLLANSEEKIENMLSILQTKALRRQIDIQCLDPQKVVPRSGSQKSMEVKLVEGIEKDIGKEINQFIKNLPVKVQSSIHDDKVRVTGKKRDDLQEVMAALKAHNFKLPLQFNNFRD